MKSKKWVLRNSQDIYVRKARNEGYVSRSAYKLIEIENKFHLILNSKNILELGSSPGGWSQVAKKEIRDGKMLSVDLKFMKKINGVDFIKGDFLDREVCDKIINYFYKKKIDIILSDMAANTTGNKDLDSYRTGELCLNAMNLAKKILSQEGIFI